MDCLRIIQGDSFEGQVEVTGVDAAEVAELKFVCADLGLTYDLHTTLVPFVWSLEIPSEDTENLRIGVFGYNIVAILQGGRVITAMYNAKVEIAYKVNKWTEAN